jgi:hypothetical protein
LNNYALSVSAPPELTTSSTSFWLAGSIIESLSYPFFFNLMAVLLAIGVAFAWVVIPTSLSVLCDSFTISAGLPLICIDLFQVAISGVSVISSISFDILPAFVISIIVVPFAAGFFLALLSNILLYYYQLRNLSFLYYCCSLFFILWLDASPTANV